MSNTKKNSTDANQNKQVNITIKDGEVHKRSMEIPPVPKVKPKDKKD